MEQLFKEVLFDRNYLVADNGTESGAGEAFPVLYSLAALFGIRIVSGAKYAEPGMISFAAGRIGIDVPAPFYKGFPETVKTLSQDELLYDQLYHYTLTYGLGAFEEPGHSVFEPLFTRSAFREKIETKDISIITEKEAEARILEIAGNFLLSSRPLGDRQYETVRLCLQTYHPEIGQVRSKNTVIRLLLDTRDLQFLRFLSMSDVMKLVSELQYRDSGRENLKKLNLKNRDRRFLASVIDRLAEEGRCDTVTCFEKKALWQGLLHHIHYKPKGSAAARFTGEMRGKGNRSVYSAFEKAMAAQDVREAVRILKEGKGDGAVLRSLDHLASRCRTVAEAEAVLDAADSKNVIVLIQLLLRYARYQETAAQRDFRFTRHNMLITHRETEEEAGKRRSVIPEAAAQALASRVEANLRKTLAGRLGKVYTDPDMERIALPIQENTSQGGFGTLPRGSRLRIPAGKKIRAFTYWEKVNDIDLSVIGLSEDGKQTEFSWRTMYENQSQAITFSGDQTSGYNGGSEYFDIETALFRAQYPDIRYLVFCDNVYSGTHFSRCFCKAGYMLRDTADSGEVFEPKTVRSAYLVNCESTFAYLFALDLRENDFIWLNTARAGRTIVAGESSMGFLTQYFDVTSVISMASFFGMMASKRTAAPEEADVIVSDRVTEAPDGPEVTVPERWVKAADGSEVRAPGRTAKVPEGAEVIRSCDFDRILALING